MSVFARVVPEHKVILVDVLQAQEKWWRSPETG